MKRQIIKIDESLCNGCGLCAAACHEGAIGMVDGKAKLLRDDYCDGLGNCLPACPTGAISFEEREAAAYDEEAVRRHVAQRDNEGHGIQSQAKTPSAAEPEKPMACGCPGTMARRIERTERAHAGNAAPIPTGGMSPSDGAAESASELSQWPVQIKLVPVRAPYLDGAHLLVAADCAAYAYAAFHRDFIRGRVALIGCPKLDSGDYTEKLTAILAENDVKSLTIARMEVPCCGGLAHAATEALRASGKFIPWQVVTIGTDGSIKA